jgi:bacterial stress protein
MGTLNLEKGGTLNLSKYNGLKKVRVGLSWDEAEKNNVNDPDADLDLSFFVLRNNRIVNPNDVVFYDTVKRGIKVNGVQGAVDNRTGAGDGDDEIGLVEFDKLDPDVNKILITASVYNEVGKEKQTFKRIRNAKIYLMNEETGEKLVETYLTEETSVYTIVEFVMLEKVNGEWIFKSLIDGSTGDLETVYKKYC